MTDSPVDNNDIALRRHTRYLAQWSTLTVVLTAVLAKERSLAMVYFADVNLFFIGDTPRNSRGYSGAQPRVNNNIRKQHATVEDTISAP